MGLEAAHHNNIVHRDVKPQNIIISTDGKVKVTDFGIARAASSNTISSNVMGSVHYSSPEQARGGYSDYKSDIYSLGITMYEMLTGHVPFDGDTTVAIAIKHLQEEMQSPRKYVPDLPKSIVQIIYKCTQKSPDRRYGDMEELIRDLKESLVNPDGDFVQIAPLNNHAQTVVVSKEELEQIKNGAQPKAEETPENDYNRNGYQDGGHTYYGSDPYGNYPRDDRYGQDGYGNGRGGQGYNQDPDDGEYDGVNKKLEKFMTIGSVVIGILILAIFLALVGSAAGFIDLGFLTGGNKAETELSSSAVADDSSLIKVPDVRGMTKDEATAALNEKGLGLKFAGERSSSTYEAGQIVEQSPEAGESVEVNTEVLVYTSKGDADEEDVAVTEKETSSLEEETDADQEETTSVTKEEVTVTDVETGYYCKVDLAEPDDLPNGYNGEPVTVTLEQDGQEFVIAEEESIQFPYRVQINSNSGSNGIILLKIKSDDGKTYTVRYKDVEFKVGSVDAPSNE
jgi:serine/threonine-protein kinase